jgi:hypothetical protein
MAFLSETSAWEAGIYQLETTDPVEGGAAGKDNVAPRQLANRTAYLKAQVDNLNTGKQPLDSTLSALSALITAADKLIYATGPDTFAMTTLSAFIRTLLDDADAATACGTLGAAGLASPAFTGIPTAPTAAAGTNTMQLATTAFVYSVASAIATAYENIVGNIKMDGVAAIGALNTSARGDHVHPTDTSRAPIASPALTGTPTAPTATAGTNTTQVATTAFVLSQIVASVVAASETVSGHLELATNAETITGTDMVRATHPAGVNAAISAAITALVNSSPAALNTLNELAIALGNDANFATTMTNALAGKAPLTGGGTSGTWPISISGSAATAPWIGISGKPTLGTAAGNNTGDFATAGHAHIGQTKAFVVFGCNDANSTIDYKNYSGLSSITKVQSGIYDINWSVALPVNCGYVGTASSRGSDAYPMGVLTVHNLTGGTYPGAAPTQTTVRIGIMATGSLNSGTYITIAAIG